MSANSKLKSCKVPGFKLDPETNKFVAVPFKQDDEYYAFFGKENPKTNTNAHSDSKANTTWRKPAWQPSSFYSKQQAVSCNVKPSAVVRKSPDRNGSCKSKAGPRKSLFPEGSVKNNAISEETQLSKIALPIIRFSSASVNEACELPVPLSQAMEYYRIRSNSASRTPAKPFPNSPGRRKARRDSLNEFLTFEEQCLSVKKPLNGERRISPISEVHTEPKSTSATNIFTEIRRLIKLEKSRLDADLQKFLEHNRSSNDNLEQLTTLVNILEQQIGDSKERDKENTVCINQSIKRIAELKPERVRYGNSIPRFFEKDHHSDMLKETLAKNVLLRAQTGQVDGTPAKDADAVDTETKNCTCDGLLTPKSTARPLQEALTNSTRSAVRFLSVKVEEQYMMLQDTPVAQ